MKRISIYRKLLVVAGCVALICVADVGVSFATVTQAAGDVVAPLTVTPNVAGLVFGKIIKGTDESTVIIDPALLPNRHIGTGTGTLGTGITPSSAELTLSGAADARYTIDYDASITLTNQTGVGGEMMTVSDLTSNPTKLAGGALSALGAAKAYVGGTLTVPSTQVEGHYTGTFNVTIAYE